MTASIEPAVLEQRPGTTTLAWLIVAMIALPPILAVSFGASLSFWHGEVASLALLGLTLVMARRVQALRPLKAFVIVWIAYLAVSIALFATLDAMGYLAWTERSSKYRWVTVSAALTCIPALAMVGAARALGKTRADLRLCRGDIHALGLIPGRPRRVSWMGIGLVSVAVVVVGASISIAFTASRAGFGLLLSWLPVGLIFATVNAAQEELRFRVAPLATLVPAVGGDAAVWMTAVVFGLAHWSEATPSGPMGLVFHGLIGAWFAKSILETNGIAWAWIMHALGNLALFCILVFEAS